jgi:hypothetical protein
MQVKCSQCSEPISVNDIFEASHGRLSHLDCSRRRGLTPDERQLLFVYCSDHVVAQCLSCGLSFRMMELAADPLDGRTNICPRCRKDLTENVRAHLYGCPAPPSEIQLAAQTVRDAAQHLITQNQQLADNLDVLIREGEAALFAAQQTLRAAMRRRTLS